MKSDVTKISICHCEEANGIARCHDRSNPKMIITLLMGLLRPDSTHRSWLSVIVMTVLFLAILPSCSKDERFLNIVPKIALKSVTPTAVFQFVDSINIVIEYEDGDGDIGYWNPDSLALSVHDLRLANPDFFYVQPQTPDSNVLAVTGTIRIGIRNTFLLGNGDSETTRYVIQLKDRESHWSNEVTTPEVTITR